MKTWPVWSEGWAATGGSSDATYHGDWPGETFADACQAWVDADPSRGRWFVRGIRPTYWGCMMFDNEADARRFNG